MTPVSDRPLILQMERAPATAPIPNDKRLRAAYRRRPSLQADFSHGLRNRTARHVWPTSRMGSGANLHRNLAKAH